MVSLLLKDPISDFYWTSEWYNSFIYRHNYVVFGMWMLWSVRKINISQIFKNFNGSYSIENFVGYDQIIMIYMTKSVCVFGFTSLSTIFQSYHTVSDCGSKHNARFYRLWQKVMYFCCGAFFRKFLIYYWGPPSNDVCHRKRHLSRESEENWINNSKKQMKNNFLL